MDTKTEPHPTYLVRYNKIRCACLCVFLSSNVSCVRRRAPCTNFGNRPIFRVARHTNGEERLVCKVVVFFLLLPFIYFVSAFISTSHIEIRLLNYGWRIILPGFLLLGDLDGWIFNGGVYLKTHLYLYVGVYRITYEVHGAYEAYDAYDA